MGRNHQLALALARLALANARLAVATLDLEHQREHAACWRRLRAFVDG